MKILLELLLAFVDGVVYATGVTVLFFSLVLYFAWDGTITVNSDMIKSCRTVEKDEVK